MHEMNIIVPSSDCVRQNSGHFYGNETCPLSMSIVILIAVDLYLSNTAESGKTNKQHFSLGNAIY